MTQCLTCESKDFEILYKIKEFPLFWGAIPKNKVSDIPSYPLEISFCKQCGLVQQTKLVDEEIINKIYTADYYNCPSPITSGMGVSEIEKFLRFFKKCNNLPSKLLEIACFDGYILRKLSAEKWDVYGCDPSSMADIAIKNLGIKKIKKSFFSSSSYPKNFFDVIIFRNLLEHMYDLHSFLSNVNNCLVENGKIFIDVPNLKEIIKRGGFGLFFHQHITYFTIKTLSILLSKNGFKVQNYFEGKPNLFVEAIKTENKSEKFVKENNKDLNDLSQNSKLMTEKILFYFNQRDINKIILFGSSAVSTTLIRLLNDKQKDKIKLIVDNDKQKHNKILSGSSIEIFNPKEVLKIDFDIILICSHFCSEQIKASLKVLGVNLSKVRTI